MIDSSAIEYLKDKPKDEWLIDDWKKWSTFCELLSEKSTAEFLRLLKENLGLNQQIEKYEAFIAKKHGMPKRIKTKGLLTAPRGRPMKLSQNKIIMDFVKAMRIKNRTWIEIGDYIDLANTQNNTNYPTSERYLRGLIKSAD